MLVKLLILLPFIAAFFGIAYYMLKNSLFKDLKEM